MFQHIVEGGSSKTALGVRLPYEENNPITVVLQKDNSQGISVTFK